MDDGQAPDPPYVVARLDQAGATLMALPARGLFPHGFRTTWPDYVHVPDADDRYAVNPARSASEAPRPRPPVPGARAISAMDEAYGWVCALPWKTDLQRTCRSIVLLRSLVWPVSDRQDPHVWSWRALGRHFDLDPQTVRTRHARTIDELVSRLRSLPDPCAATVQRILRARATPATSRRDAMLRR